MKKMSIEKFSYNEILKYKTFNNNFRCGASMKSKMIKKSDSILYFLNILNMVFLLKINIKV